MAKAIRKFTGHRERMNTPGRVEFGRHDGQARAGEVPKHVSEIQVLSTSSVAVFLSSLPTVVRIFELYFLLTQMNEFIASTRGFIVGSLGRIQQTGEPQRTWMNTGRRPKLVFAFTTLDDTRSSMAMELNFDRRNMMTAFKAKVSAPFTPHNTEWLALSSAPRQSIYTSIPVTQPADLIRKIAGHIFLWIPCGHVYPMTLTPPSNPNSSMH